MPFKMLARLHGLQRRWRTCSRVMEAKVMEAKVKQSSLFRFHYGQPKDSEAGLDDPNLSFK